MENRELRGHSQTVQMVNNFFLQQLLWESTKVNEAQNRTMKTQKWEALSQTIKLNLDWKEVLLMLWILVFNLSWDCNPPWKVKNTIWGWCCFPQSPWTPRWLLWWRTPSSSIGWNAGCNPAWSGRTWLPLSSHWLYPDWTAVILSYICQMPLKKVFIDKEMSCLLSNKELFWHELKVDTKAADVQFFLQA